MAMPENHVLETHVSLDPASTSNTPQTYTYYHAGPLFTLAELHTNVILSKAVKSRSANKFIPVLPQDLEQRDTSPHSIRDEDLKALLSCDLALFTYDGSELDPGTVVEYMVAKMADIPSVILRTDFRGGGDQAGTGDSWNLMSSFWPRTVALTVDSMVVYKAGLNKALGSDYQKGAGEHLVNDIASRIVDAFDKVLLQEPKLPQHLRSHVYEWISIMPGFRDGVPEDRSTMMTKLGEDKATKGLL